MKIFILMFLVGYSQALFDIFETKQIRNKRQSNECGGGCFLSFIGEMSKSSAAAKIKGKGPEGESIFAFFDKEVLTLCPAMKTLMNCVSECPGAATEILEENSNPAVTALQFMCIDNYHDAQKHAACFAKTNKTVSGVCEEKCDGEKTMKEVSKLDNLLGDDENTGKIFVVIDKLCGYVYCLGECASPILEEKCESEAPGLFLRNFIRFFIGGLMSPLTKLGLPSIIPKNCQKLNSEDFAPVGNSTINNQIEASLDFKDPKELEFRKLEREGVVLEKESRKLDLEIEVLELEKKYYTQTAKDLGKEEKLKELKAELIQKEYIMLNRKNKFIDAEIKKLKIHKKYLGLLIGN